MLRTGPMGALMDEYERALKDLIKVVNPLNQINYPKEFISDRFNSFQSVITHVLNAGFHYSNDIRDVFDKKKKDYSPYIKNIENVETGLLKMFDYMLETVEDLMSMPENEFGRHLIPVEWNQEYDIEQLIEHAIVHILRHRRQLEKFWKLLD